MPRPKSLKPAYCLHKPSGRAFVTLHGKRIYWRRAVVQKPLDPRPQRGVRRARLVQERAAMTRVALQGLPEDGLLLKVWHVGYSSGALRALTTNAAAGPELRTKS